MSLFVKFNQTSCGNSGLSITGKLISSALMPSCEMTFRQKEAALVFSIWNEISQLPLNFSKTSATAAPPTPLRLNSDLIKNSPIKCVSGFDFRISAKPATSPSDRISIGQCSSNARYVRKRSSRYRPFVRTIESLNSPRSFIYNCQRSTRSSVSSEVAKSAETEAICLGPQ